MSEYEQDVAEAIRIILHTRKGERLMRPDFGSNLHSFVFDVMSQSTLTLIENEVRDCIIMWEPRVENIEVQVTPNSEHGSGAVNIAVSYTVRLTNNQYNLVFPYFLNEG
ncbi:MAG: GPW/gp25 family protein [Oscillospiraceae bacterium]|nr:GPW/gp25 family protein [Oscillospiraceae bacterium]